MTNMRRIIARGLFLTLIIYIGGCASRGVITLSDVDPKLEFLREIGIDIELIEYQRTGITKYNEFFQSSAMIYFTMEVSHKMVLNATTNLKKYAMDHMAKMAMDENLQELVGNTPADQLSKEQALAVMKMEKERGNISRDEAKYFLTMAGQLGIGTLALARGIKEAPALISKGTALLSDVTGDFTFFGIPKLWEIPRVVKGLKESTNRLKQVRKNGPVLSEDIIVLAKGFKALSG